MKVRTINFMEYIKNRTFYIPVYQREFVWKKDNINSFVEEIIECYESDINNHSSENEMNIFSGGIYLKPNNENNLDIIDGQQRTTFIYGLKWALFNKMTKIKEDFEKYDTDISEKEKCKYLDIYDALNSFNLTTATSQKENSFEKQIQKNKGSIITIFNDLKKILDNYISKELDNKPSNVVNFINFIFSRVILIEIIIDDRDNVNDIFKNINSKGQSLSTWDIIRNDIYKNSDMGEKLLEQIDNYLEDISLNYYIKKDEFIRGYLMYKTKKYVSNKKINNIFDEFLKQNKPEIIKKDIENFYNKMQHFDKKDINYLKCYFQIVREFKFTQITIFSLAIIMSLGIENEIPSSIKKLFINAVLHISIDGGRGNVFEKFFGSSDNILNFLNDIKGEKLINAIENEKFYESNKNIFSSDNIKEKINEKHLLIKLFIWLRTPILEHDKIINFLNLDYEYILPKSYLIWKNEYKYWENISDSDIENLYLEKLGNITLVNKSLNKLINKKILNLSYEEKFQYYYENEIGDQKNDYYIFTKHISSKDINLNFLVRIFDIYENSIWDKEVINERTEKITSAIIETLKNNY